MLGGVESTGEKPAPARLGAHRGMTLPHLHNLGVVYPVVFVYCPNCVHAATSSKQPKTNSEKRLIHATRFGFDVHY